MLVTVLTQVVSAILGLRGTNLLWATQTLLRTIHPALEAQAEAILTHPIISDSSLSRFYNSFKNTPLLGRFLRRWTLATAIGPDELVRMLARRSQELRAAAGHSAEIAGVIDSVLGDYDPEALRKAVVVRAGLRNLGQGYALPVDRAIQQMTSGNGVGKVEAWFGTAMDRASQRFTTQMRVWTILFSVAITFLVQIDAFKVLESPSLQLIPTPYQFLYIESWRSFAGMLVTAILLSLGAPFWFNTLKSLASLRPVVARKQDQFNKV